MTSEWANWGRNLGASPAEVATPTSADQVAEVLAGAAARGLAVRPAGSSHSFSPLVPTDGVLLRTSGLGGVRAVDRAAGRVTVGAGTTLRETNAALARHGLALANLGDVDVQTVAGAVGTGTHGSGRGTASLSAQVAGLELVLADGTVTSCSADRDPELFQAARLGLGALGVVTAVTLDVVPAFLLHAVEAPMPLDELLDRFEELALGEDHLDVYWFPFTARTLVKRHNRVGPGTRPSPPGRLGRWLSEELLDNAGLDLLQRAGRAAPRWVPGLGRVAGWALGERDYIDVSHRVLASRRRVRFVEMEYAVPRAALVPLLRRVRPVTERHGVGFPVELRVSPSDDVWLSPAHGRDTAYLAVHVYRHTPHQAYFAEVEALAREVGGRPHWGKVHGGDAAFFRAAYPCFDRFRAVRDRVDPDRLFGSDHLRSVLGD